MKVLDGGKGRSADKQAQDLAAVTAMQTTAPALSDAFVQQTLADNQEVIAACEQRVKAGKKAAAKAKARPQQPVPQTTDVASSSVQHGNAAVDAVQEVVPTAAVT